MIRLDYIHEEPHLRRTVDGLIRRVLPATLRLVADRPTNSAVASAVLAAADRCEEEANWRNAGAAARALRRVVYSPRTPCGVTHAAYLAARDMTDACCLCYGLPVAAHYAHRSVRYASDVAFLVHGEDARRRVFVEVASIMREAMASNIDPPNPGRGHWWCQQR